MKSVFVSYSHRDEALRAELEKHLALLKRQAVLDLWSDHRIVAGSEIDASISEGLENADVVLLLVSSDYVDSNYCYGTEMGRAMERHHAGDCVVVPVILRPCDWKTAPFGMLKAVPTDGKPITKWPSQDEGFERVASHLRELLESAPPAASKKMSPLNTSTPAAAPKPSVRSTNVFLPRRFSDQERHDFTLASFEYVREFFDGSLYALRTRNQQVETRMANLTARSFTVVIFRFGSRAASCHIRLDNRQQAEAIAYSSGENSPESTYNELLTVKVDTHTLYLHASLNAAQTGSGKLTQQGAAEHLWALLIGPLQQAG